jgi:hypothetical protein
MASQFIRHLTLPKHIKSEICKASLRQQLILLFLSYDALAVRSICVDVVEKFAIVISFYPEHLDIAGFSEKFVYVYEVIGFHFP